MDTLLELIQVKDSRPFVKKSSSTSGKRGLQPNYPIISYGIIGIKGDMRILENIQPMEKIPKYTIQLNDNIEYLMICRSNTFGYIDFMKGNYSLSNIKHIKVLINEMTIFEKSKLLVLSFEDLYRRLTKSNKQSANVRNDESKKKFEALKNGIVTQDEKKITLELLIEESDTEWENNEWEFPKGRKNYKEKDLDCAKREFEEETGISCSDLQIVNNIMPFEEIFTGSNQKCYKNIYYLGIVNKDVSMSNYQETEVSIMEWKTYQNCMESVRNYNIEKISIISSVNDFIQKLCFI